MITSNINKENNVINIDVKTKNPDNVYIKDFMYELYSYSGYLVEEGILDYEDENTKELVFVIKSFLQSLYYDKEISISSKTFTNINKLYDMALENANDISETLDKNEFVIIGLKDCKGKIIKLSDELTEQIKSLL
jgi:hypothetical protein